MKELELQNRVQSKTRVEKKEFDIRTRGREIAVTREEKKQKKQTLERRSKEIEWKRKRRRRNQRSSKNHPLDGCEILSRLCQRALRCTVLHAICTCINHSSFIYFSFFKVNYVLGH